MEKTCPKCHITKPLQEFGKRTRTLDGYFPSCKACRIKKAAERNKAHPEQILTEKTCLKCKQVKPIEEFYKERQRKDGHGNWCIQCVAESIAIWRAAMTPEMIQQRNEKSKAWRKDHPEEVLIKNAKAVARYTNDPEVRQRAKEQNAKSLAAHPERALRKQQTRKAWCEANAERLRLKRQAWHAANPENGRASRKRRRARKANAPINDFTAAQWIELQTEYGHRCAYCGKRAKGRLTMDHITPLSKGGSHTLANIVPSCKPCNSRKHTNPAPFLIQPLLLTIAPPAKKKEKPS